jgi:putative N6-adenine-specific DNA methylase
MENEKVRFFISCAPGIEEILDLESRQIGLIPLAHADRAGHSGKTGTGEDSGGLMFEGFYSHVLSANLRLRSASRVIVRLGEFHATAFSELRKKASRLEWERYLLPGQAVNIQAVCHKSKLYHTDAVAERVLGAINDHFSFSNAPQKPCPQDAQGQMVLVRLVNDLCTISVDSSGEHLHKRGYRQAVAKAPLRETLAAAMLLSSNWDGQSPLIDPFCGSGTIPIEAALLARRIPPGIAREFAFEKWPVFPKEMWSQQLEKARSEIIPLSSRIQGFDRDKGAVEMAIANSSRAGQKSEVVFRQQAISSLEPTGMPGWIVTNPPYGVRVSADRDLRDLYARFGEVLRTKFPGWKVGILCSDPKLTGQMNIGTAVSRLRFSNGGVPVQFSIFTIGS